jgi:hypothetical protein
VQLLHHLAASCVSSGFLLLSHYCDCCESSCWCYSAPSSSACVAITLLDLAASLSLLQHARFMPIVLVMPAALTATTASAADERRARPVLLFLALLTLLLFELRH